MSGTPNARQCPTCGALGIVRLPAEFGDRGRLVDPTMVCPLCEREFTAAGMTYQSFGRPPIDEGDEALEAWCEAAIDHWLGQS